MKKWVKILIWIILLAGGITLCAVRWQAWLAVPDEPEWTGDTLTYALTHFPSDSGDAAGFVRTERGWQDTAQPEQLDILVLGDIHNRLTRADYDTLAARIPSAELILQTGDWLERGQFYYRQLLLREWLGCGLDSLPVVTCPGNHDYSKGLFKQLSPVWLETFAQPLNAPYGVPESNFLIDFPNLRLIVLDTNPLYHVLPITRTLTWLHSSIDGADGRFVIVLMHHPAVSVGRGRFNPLIYSHFRYALGRADLVIAGHEHSYARHLPFVILNTAGKTKPQRNTIYFDCMSEQDAYMHLAVSDTLMQLRTYRLGDGLLLDSAYVSRH